MYKIYINFRFFRVYIDILGGDSHCESSWQCGASNRQMFSPSEFLGSAWGHSGFTLTHALILHVQQNTK